MEIDKIDPRDQRAIRIAKIEKLRAEGIDPYPARIGEGRVPIESVRANWNNMKRETDDEGNILRAGEIVRLAGRITAIRSHGKSMFVAISDGSGDFQFYIKKNIVDTPEDSESYARAKELDLGDFITARGELFTTRSGEPTLMVHDWALISKALLQLPEKYHGLTDPDLRLRRRYLDLLVNPEVKRNLRIRALIIRTMRDFLESDGYIELETPVLTPLYGGAAARPFITYHNALDIKLYLRIATELYLKRLIVGGFERVYEMGKVFRNEGIDRDHNPEFTLLELYEAYADYNRMMEIAEGMVVACAKAVAEFFESEAIAPDSGESKTRIEPPFPRKKFVEEIKEATDIDVMSATKDDLIAYFKKNDIDHNPTLPYWPLVDRLFSETVEPKLIEPTFVIDYPVGLSPLAKRKSDEPELTERFELFINGIELANAFSELNDPLDQRARMEAQLEQHAAGDEESPHKIDEDFLTALEHGMPPTGGMGIGVGRLVTILSGAHSLKEIIPFPLMKPKE